jgi:RNA polymerase sigma-70 factor (ECF subfamily)
VITLPGGTGRPAPPRPPRPPRSPRESVAADFSEFYSANFHPLVVQLVVHTGDLAEAQDVVQEAFCRALDRWSRLGTYDDPAAWIRRVAWNLATSRWRRMRSAITFARRQRDEPIPGPSPDRVALTAAIARLPRPQQRVVVLHYVADMTVPAIAAELEVAEGTVKSWLSRARAALAAELGDCDTDTDSGPGAGAGA